jgi:hypothetical protein
LLLISGAAEAGQMRSLTLASNAPAVEQTQQSAPAQQAQPPVRTETRAAAKADAGKDASKADVKTEQACGTGERSHDDGRDHDRRPVRHHESAEHKARRIAAQYGVYW